ncbi:Zinc finger, C3HC4 type (RING finger) containing protein, putative [Angomonas deanei]|uniref:Zinc finger, C3HC4 type (RING finger) containing protein, putative n=1 Tax=Angomonas deanei TaxID=59799 RepID=A0A7G2CS68_9TRYP|nr:Zinc finger, C3HC4 type (RING finger) containing protein, putative [Angomonas deanei]
MDCSGTGSDVSFYSVFVSISVGFFLAAVVLLLCAKLWTSWVGWRRALASRPVAPTDFDDDALEGTFCCVCFLARPTVVFLPCHHSCACEPCCNRLRSSEGIICCPLCRTAIVAMASLPAVLKGKISVD